MSINTKDLLNASRKKQLENFKFSFDVLREFGFELNEINSLLMKRKSLPLRS